MNGHHAGLPDPAPSGERPRAARGRTGEAGRQCVECGAIGTHYLTCPGLRLPAGYRLTDATGPQCRCGRSDSNCRCLQT
jgi:hypothetical protein